MSTLLGKAIALAAKIHEDQVGKSGHPYILHPIAVMLSCKTEAERVVAILHDVLEESSYTPDDLFLQQGYPKVIVNAVDALSRRVGESEKEYYNRIKENLLSVRVKIADLEHNMDIKRLPKLCNREVKRLRTYYQRWRELTEIRDKAVVDLLSTLDDFTEMKKEPPNHS